MNTREENEKLRALLREIRPTIPRDVLELWCKDRDSALSQQTEQQPVACVRFRNGEVDYDADDNIVISNMPGDEDNGVTWWPVYIAPVAQTELVEALRLALPIVEHEAKKMQSAEQQFPTGFDSTDAVKALAAIKAALAQPAKEPRE